MSLNLGSILANSARCYPGERATYFHLQQYTYEELDARARRFAHSLSRAGLEHGDTVALAAPNEPRFTIAYFGALYAGCVVLPLNPLLLADEMAYQLRDADARALVLHADCLNAGLSAFGQSRPCEILYVIEGPDRSELPTATIPFDDATEEPYHSDLARTRPEETAVILYTSGTTGEPKGAELTHANLYSNARYISEHAFSSDPDQVRLLGPGNVGLAALPLYHCFGQTNIQNAMLMVGGAVSYLKRFSAVDAAAAIARGRVTFFPGVPTMFFDLLHSAEIREESLASLRLCVAGGAPMPAKVKRAFEERFHVRIQEAYGLTETSPLTATQRINDTRKCGSVGKAISGVEIRIFDDADREVPQGEPGEVVIRGENVMKGYYKRPDATRHALRGGWLHTGDVGYLDGDGDLFIVDRKKDVILRGGYSVYPREIEEVLYTHPAVREAAVIAVPDERLGEEVKAVVAVKEGHQVTGKEIVEYCRQHLARYKYPRLVEFRDQLPKGTTGKVLKKKLRERTDATTDSGSTFH